MKKYFSFIILLLCMAASFSEELCIVIDPAHSEKMQNLGMGEQTSGQANNCIGIDLGFLSNTEDALLLSDENFQTLCSGGIFNGIKAIIEI